ncbi:MAG: FliG C-terminal domain-containing protein [Pseudomonadota bacterium]
MSETPLSPPPPSAQAPVIHHLSSAQRAAIILSLLDPEEARQLAQSFDPGAVDRAVAAFESLRIVDRGSILEAIATFVTTVKDHIPVVAGGARQAEKLASRLAALTHNDGTEAPPALEDRGSLDAGADAEAVWAYLRRLEPEQLATLLQAERPAVIAAVVQRLDRKGGSTILQMLPDEIAVNVVRIVMNGRQPAPRTYDAIAESLRRNAPGRLAEAENPQADPSGQLAEIFNTLPAARQETLLAPLRGELPDETKAVESKLLRFAILHERLPRTIVPTVFREITQDVLDKALKHGLAHHSETTEFLFGSISQRLAEQIRERIEEMPRVSEEDGEAAQTELMGALLSWAEEGRFTFKELEEDA